MSKSKTKASIVIAVTAILAIIFTLVFPQVGLYSQTFSKNDGTYIFGFTSIFGGTVIPKGSNIKCDLVFNIGGFFQLLFIVLGLLFVIIFDKQISSYAIAMIFFIVSSCLFPFSTRFVNEANGLQSGFTAYLYTNFGTWVSLGFSILLAIESAFGIYIVKSDLSPYKRHK